MKKIILFSFIAAFANISYSQLKVTPAGAVGIGTNTPVGTLHVNGTLILTGNGNTFRFLPNNPGTEIGTTTDRIDFWHTITGHNNLYAANFYTVSDSTTKTNIRPLQDGLIKLNNLQSYSYEVQTGAEGAIKSKLEYGFLSQDVAKYFPHMTDYSKDLLLLDYKQILPIVVEAVKEQQDQIETLQARVNELELLIQGEVESLGTETKELGNEKTVLLQNDPNPFNESTRIQFEISETGFNSASILVFNMNGTLLKSIAISNHGKGEVFIQGKDLEAGMFIYSLVVNNKEVDSKRMILLK